MTDKVQYWIDIADYDMETARAMFETSRWLYVGFMCHQVIEKTLKAYWAYKKPDEIPFTHNLLKLAQSTGLMTQLSDEQLELLTNLVPLNIETRYPDYKNRLSATLSKEKCEHLIHETSCLQNWIKEKLSV